MSEKRRKPVEFDDKGKPLETVAYQQFRQYYESFIIPGNIIQALEERRRFFRGDQYAKDYAKNAPKPTLNLVQEGVVKISAKICGTKRHISFVSDKDDEALEKLDDYYEFLSAKIGRDLTIAESTMVALIDGSSPVFTAFDADTIGSEGIYKGFLKDHVAPFETTFWSDPWNDDPQSMRYCGYYIDMEVSAARALIEGTEKEREYRAQYVCSENFFFGQPPYDFEKINDSDRTRVYVRFFQKDGETYFEMATQYVNLTDHPHALNPEVTEAKVAEMYRKLNEGEEELDSSMRVQDISDPAKYVAFTKPERQSHGGHVKTKRKFWRFPVAVNIPYPEMPHRCILGRSLAAAIIPNQKLYNYCYLLVTLIMQYHAMPKWIAKPNALGNQTIDNSPNQVIIDYSSIQEVGGNGFGLTRMSSGEAINSDLIQIGDNIAAQTRTIHGFANLEADGVSIDSGYEYSQRMKQVNLPLEIPQMRVWKFCGELAKTDLMYMTHYVDEAKFYRVRSDSDLALNENYRQMSQEMIDAGKSTLPRGTRLPKSRRYEVQTLEKGFFDSDFDVNIEVEQGIAGSELTESQHYNQVWQYVAQGNLTADKIRMLVRGDPAFSRKTRAKTVNALEELETSQLAMKDQQIQALQQAVDELKSYAQFGKQVIEHQRAKIKATEQAAADQTRVAAELLKSKDQQLAQNMSESEVKSLNAKGISGGSFAGGGSESIYNTGA